MFQYCDAPDQVGRILFMFRINFPVCVLDSKVPTPLIMMLARVQNLQNIGLCDVFKWPVVRLHSDNEVSIIKLNSIGPVAVVGAHPNNTQHHFVVLPWRRSEQVQTSMAIISVL